MPLLELGTANVQAGNIMSRFGTLQTAGGGGGFSGGLSLFDPTGMMDWIDRQPRFASMLPSQLELAMSRDALTSGIMRRSADNPWGVFVEGAGQFVGVESVPSASGYHVTTAGLTVGIDRQVMDATTYPHDQMVVGLAIGYANAASYLSGDSRVNINGVQGTAYSTWFHDGWHVEAAAGGGVNLYDTKRVVFGQDARGHTQGTDIQGLLGGGYDWKTGPWTFGPRATVQYTKVDIDGFTESGSLAPLTISAQGMNSLLTQLGGHLARAIEVGKTVWTPELRLGWQHESMDSSTLVDAQFANGSGNIFNSRSVPLGRDAAVVGAGLSVQWSKSLTTYVNYDTELMRNNYSVHNVNAGIRFSF
jgi:outer membrane autotransporter protein